MFITNTSSQEKTISPRYLNKTNSPIDIEDKWIEKEETKLSLFDDNIIYIQNTKEYGDKLLES